MSHGDGAPSHHPALSLDHAEMLRRWVWRDFANILFGLRLLASPSSLGYRSDASGVALMMLSLPRGRIQERFGGWNRYLAWWSPRYVDVTAGM